MKKKQTPLQKAKTLMKEIRKSVRLKRKMEKSLSMTKSEAAKACGDEIY